MKSPRRLSVEHLEDRTTPAWGIPWFDGSSLTLSFVPDGTNISGNPSNLSSLLGSAGTPQEWQREILRAYQTWVVEANLNVGLVGDGGQPMGIAGPPQGDIRFGDIRIGARALSDETATHANMAGAVGFDYNSKTWAGDMLLNSRFDFGIGDHHDLYSVALHEAGHSFGLPDDHEDSDSVLYARYQGQYTGLAPEDIAALRSLYGERQNDAYEGSTGNETLATAFDLSANGNLTAVSADVTSHSDVDFYRFVTPSDAGITGLTVKLQAAGISLLTAQITVLNEQGEIVASTATTDPLDNNLSIEVPNYQPSATYYVKVQGSGSDVFSIGSYVLKTSYRSNALAPMNPGATIAFNSNVVGGANNSQSEAQTLDASNIAKGNSFVVTGSLNNPNDAAWYRITPTAPSEFTGTLFVGTIQTADGFLPAVSVFNAEGVELPAVVKANDGGSYQVQLEGATTGTTYFIRVAAADPSGGHATGAYTLGATLAPVGATQFDPVITDTLTASQTTQYSTMTVEGDRLTQFAITASGGSETTDTAVRMTIFDANGQSVFTTVALSGQSMSTGLVWLAAGEYTLVFNAATRDGSALSNLSVDLSARTLSDPIDPYVDDPTVAAPPPAPLPPVVVINPAPTPPPTLPIIDPITNPFMGLFGFM